MFSPDQYALLDFGGGRKLERFGEFVLDRPCLEAESDTLSDYGLWSTSNVQFVRSAADRGVWSPSHAVPGKWTIEYQPATLSDEGTSANLQFELKATDFGHVGLFPEQAANWEWLTTRLTAYQQPPTVLNLFAYTGGSTLAAAVAGAEVVHVDGAQNTVAWARRNAELSGLDDAPIRWIVEDARKFVGREVRRGNRYNGIILDPPSYGHGPKGEVWKLSHHLHVLLRDCASLLRSAEKPFILLTCHTDRVGLDELRQALETAIEPLPRGKVEAQPLVLESTSGRRLPSGIMARWSVD